MSDWVSLVVLGAVGAISVEILSLHNMRRATPRTSRFLRNPIYWVMSIVWILVGSVSAFLLLAEASGYGLLVPFLVGMAAPLWFQKLLAGMSQDDPHPTPEPTREKIENRVKTGISIFLDENARADKEDDRNTR